jgi:GT2 family glycosyltransferase
MKSFRSASRQSLVRESGELSAHGMSFCVAICTRDRPQLLRRALHSLMQQSITPQEILVIDNAPSTDATLTLVREQFPDVRYIRENEEGLDFARNRALSETTCDIVGFIDDDVVADKEWLASAVDVFRLSDGVAICTGRVEALTLESDGQRLFEANRGFSHGDATICLPFAAGRQRKVFRKPMIAWSISVGVGCSFVLHRQTALELGGFDVALDLGAVLPGGGDHDMIWRVLQAGHSVIYEPAMLAWHEHRKDRDAAIDQILGHNRATVAMVTKAVAQSTGMQRGIVSAFLVWRLLKPGLRLLRRVVGKDPLPTVALIRLWWHSILGVWAYPAAQRLIKERQGH